MFGDPVTNPKDFPIKILSEFYLSNQEGTKCGPFGSALKKEELVNNGIPVWNMDNIDIAGRMVLPFRMWITEKKYKKLISYTVNNGDVIISRAGTVGKMCVAYTDNSPSIISTNLIRVRFGNDLLPIYFVSLMTYCKGRVGRLKTGPDGSFTHMSTGVLDDLKFPYPPANLQHRFATIVESVEKQKSRLRAHLAELDTLFASLQSRAFNGEL
jgi:type I restriction enzyme S subunit